MDTIELTIALPAAEHDRYLALLEDAATGFVQNDAELRAYVPADRWATVDHESLEARLAADGYPDALSIRPLAAKNWNAVWEDTLSPVRAGPFLICPTAAKVPPDATDATVLRINPAMSFGTGHHATTRLALQLLAGAGPLTEKRVLDVGTGTGVLAIAACCLDAAAALGVDTNPDAVRNARENARRNDAGDCVTIDEGSVEVVPETRYDLVAANITRRVLLDLLPDLCTHLAADGALVLSGLLRPQRDDLIDATEAHDLHLDAERTEDGWWAARFTTR